ncbi:MAG TPA: O-antigen ligase family protein [Bryobacteraceae bacterium]
MVTILTMGVLLPVLAAMVPLIVLPWWSFYYDVTPRVVLILAGAAFVLLSPAFWRVPATRSGKQFLALTGFQAAALALATIFSTRRGLSFLGSTWRKEGLPVELAILIWGAATFIWISSDPFRLRLFLRITVLASLPVALYGIAQYFGIDPLLPPAGYHFGEGKFEIVRPPSTLGHAAYFATFLLYPLFAGVALAKSETGRAWKTAAFGAAVAAGFGIVLSGTRAALLGGLAGLVFLAFRQAHSESVVRVKANEGLTANRLRFAIGAAAAIAMLVAFYLSPAGERLRARVHWSEEDSVGGARLLLWRDTLRMAGARWTAGYGPETFVVEFPSHESPALARAHPDFYHESPHNIFLEAFVSSGVLGLLAFAGWTAFGLAYARGPTGAAFVAMLVSQQFTAFTAPTELYFYISLAIVAASAPGVSAFRAVGSGKMVAQALACEPPLALRAALAAPFALFAILLGTGDAMLASARRALDRNDVETAGRTVTRARAWHAAADIYFSRRLLAAHLPDPASRLRAWKAAMAAARSAPDTADDPMNAFVNLASFYAGESDVVNVEKTLRASISAAPNWFKSHWLLAQILALEGQVPAAQAEARAAAERDGGRDAEVLQLVQRLTNR